MKRILSLIVLICGILAGSAQPACPDIEVSVLTCSPGQEVYSLYGHTAIRVTDRKAGTDLVFNYGVFDFNSEYFLWRFVLGKTDYICMATPWDYFLREYKTGGRSVVAQVLNLTENEALGVRDYLYNNIRRENRTYRYNFLTNNCTTRVMDCIDSCITGQIVYSWKEEPKTYRRILHEYTDSFPWTREGNDVLLGADVDTLLSHKATCFIPGYYMHALSNAVVRNDFQDTRKLVHETVTLVEASPSAVKEMPGFPLTPLEAGWMFFAIALAIMLMEFLTRKMFWPLDIILLLLHGLAGCLILFMFLFSEHPTLGSNWLVGVLNPLPLIALPFVTKAAWHDRRTLWHYFMAVWLAVFMLFMPWMPQHMCVLAVPVIATLLSRHISYILHYGRACKPCPGGKRKKLPKKK